nr:type I inositol polyphosphate 5-phosphatase 4-like [Tanacetum cinerariifolium]
MALWCQLFLIVFHPQTDGQSARTIQTLKDMLSMNKTSSNQPNSSKPKPTGTPRTAGSWTAASGLRSKITRNGFDMSLPVVVCSGLVNTSSVRRWCIDDHVVLSKLPTVNEFDSSLPRAVCSWTSQLFRHRVIWHQLAAMDNNYKPKVQKFGRWFSMKHKSKTRSLLFKHLSDEYEENEDDSFMSLEMDPCMMTNELRIFVATWNVAGRSLVESLAFDLDEWLNIKESADIYVLGFQEIVPLKAKNVIGGEDMTEATNWNLLIGQILNDKCACRWASPMTDPITSDQDYNYLNNTTGGTSTKILEEDVNNHCG